MKHVARLACLVLVFLSGAPGIAGETPKPTLEMFKTGDAPCYDRTVQSQTPVVDTHVHFRPFGGPAIPFREVVSYLERTGVLFVNMYGIGQRLPVGSTCTYYLDCPGTPVRPGLTNDFANAADSVRRAPDGVHITLSMTFPDLSRPESILPGMQLQEREYPGAFTWMGEVNLVKQALFNNGHRPVPPAKIPEWAAFMTVLREEKHPTGDPCRPGERPRAHPIPAFDPAGAAPSIPETRSSGCTWDCPRNW